MTKKWLENFETLEEFIEANGEPWTVGTTRGTIPAEVETALLARWKFDRLSIRKSATNYVARVRALFDAIASTSMWNIWTTYTTRDAILGDLGGQRVMERTMYAAPDGDVETAYATGSEKATETLPMSETVDRALAAQDGMKDAVEEAVRCFTFCFLGVIG